MSALALLCGLSLVQRPAEACGGLFCDSSNVVNQAAERIVFSQDGEGNVTQIVEILYDGDADQFAWLLPVPGTPTPGVSSTQALDSLQRNTNPQYQLNVSRESCYVDGGEGDSTGGDGDGDGDGDSLGGGGVVVLDSGQVGEFEYDTIQVIDPDEPGQAAVDWLEENGYDIGDIGAVVLEPYLANGLNLMAFKLQKNASEGAIRPISLEFVAQDKYQVGMTIPLRPTAVAANDDMPILVWVLGEDRAIPTNYYSLELNELLINWFSPSNNYNDVVTAAADAAGGQGFVTEYAKDRHASDLVGYGSARDAFDDIVDLESGRDLLVRFIRMFGGFDGMIKVVTDTVPLRDGVTASMFVQSPECYFDPEARYYNYYDYDSGDLCEGFQTEVDDWGNLGDDDPIFDLNFDDFVAAVETEVLDPIKQLDDLVDDLPYITRLYTTMSADEMSTDPAFDYNPDLEDVDNVHRADATLLCDYGFKATLPDGTEVLGESWGSWPFSVDGEEEMPQNARVLQHSVSGEPEVVDDFRDKISEINATNTKLLAPTVDPDDDDEQGDAGKGCSVESTAPEGGSFWAVIGLAVLGLGQIRRRLISRS